MAFLSNPSNCLSVIENELLDGFEPKGRGFESLGVHHFPSSSLSPSYLRAMDE